MSGMTKTAITKKAQESRIDQINDAMLEKIWI